MERLLDILKASVRNWNEPICECCMCVQSFLSFPLNNLTVLVCNSYLYCLTQCLLVFVIVCGVYSGENAKMVQ